MKSVERRKGVYVGCKKGRIEEGKGRKGLEVKRNAWRREERIGKGRRKEVRRD